VSPDGTSGHHAPSADGTVGPKADQRLQHRTAHLIATLEQVIEILNDHDEPWWASKLANLQPGESMDLRQLLPGRGGAEDFHAVYLTSRDGRWLNREDGRVVNERLSLLRATLYMDARMLMKGS
jgi:hypothetical protein